MKIIWEATDITAGRRVRSLGCNETWMVGYGYIDPISGPHAALISLNDGCISHHNMTREAMARLFNECGHYPTELLNEAGHLKLEVRERARP